MKKPNEEVHVESQRDKLVEGNLQLIPFQQTSSDVVFGGRTDVEGIPSRVANPVSSQESSQGSMEAIGRDPSLFIYRDDKENMGCKVEGSTTTPLKY